MDVRYAHSGNIEIAFRTLGKGPLTIVWVAGSLSNLEVIWEHPDYRRFCERLASFAQLVLFDKRGMDSPTASRSEHLRKGWTTSGR